MRFYQVDAFTGELFSGNPAGVCILEGNWPEEARMLQIAEENALPETAFLLQRDGAYHIRWFAPLSEIYLCGHATLATGHVLFRHEGYEGDRVVLHSNRGELWVERRGDLLTLDFPICRPEPIEMEDRFRGCFNLEPVEVYRAMADIMFVYGDERDIAGLKPDLARIAAINGYEGIIVTAKGDEVDFVSRVFAPRVGIDEDPVTGSAHTAFAAYWQGKLGKDQLVARQLSRRFGELLCEVRGDRVLLSGKAVTYLAGEIFL